MKDFIGFISKVAQKEYAYLGREFLMVLEGTNNVQIIGNWFNRNGFAVSNTEIQKIISNKDSIIKPEKFGSGPY